jgi:2-amino-4-hydroxy-6-hydroxymethyldihydropteridine diphosphokinase
MNAAYLLIGGNIGDRIHFLEQARNAIADECGPIINASAIYETEAWGLKDQSAFLNQALCVDTNLNAHQLLDQTQEIEERLGRIREVRYGPRTIDIDILLYNDSIIDTHHLRVPHPELIHRRFALQCLDDIAASLIHPVYNKTINELLLECADESKVDKFI